MRYRQVPGTDLQLSVLAIGGWLTFGGSVDEATSHRILHTAVDAGINFLDLADVYSHGAAEQVVGNFLAQRRRSDLIVSSKVFFPMSDAPGDRGLSRAHVLASIDATLQRLRLSHLDLYFCHREDPATPLPEIVATMGGLVQAGKVRAWGTSCWRPATLRAAVAEARAQGVPPPKVEQPCYNLLQRDIEGEVLPTCQELGLGVVVWSPLAGGALTGKYIDGVPPGSRAAQSRWLEPWLQPKPQAQLRAFVAACRQRSVDPAVVALAFLLQRRELTSVITGATHERQLQTNLAAEAYVPDAAFLAELDRLFPFSPPSALGKSWQKLKGAVRRLRGS
ncbi:MAG: aldo/keto reductase [Planctomycetes bacterium]|nr:aldo/keto reductase [Planctomycetota bacterium]